MKVAIYPGKKNSCEVRYKVAGDWVRETVPKDEAEARKAEVETYLKQMTVPLSHDEAQEYRVAKKRLEGADMIQATDYYMNHHSGDRVLVSDEIKAYMDWSMGFDQAPSTLRTKEHHLKKFQEGMGTRTYLEDIVTWQVEAFLRHYPCPKTHNNVRISLLGLFNWARKVGDLSAGSHAVDGTFAKKVPVKDPVPFTPDELQVLLDEAVRREDWESMLIMALGAFAGIRMSEMARLRWGAIRSYEIELTSQITKTRRRRTVEIGFTLRRILDLYLSHTPERFWGVKDNFIIQRKNPNRNLRDIAEKGGLEWVKNGLRKGFVSHCTELIGAEKAAKVAGHSVAVLETSYKGLVTKEDAEAWFNTFPACTPAISGV